MLSKCVASMTIGTSMGQEICLIVVQVSLSLLYQRRILQTDFCGPGGDLTRKQLTSRPDYSWPELWEKMGRNAKLKERQKWSHEKPQLDNARKLLGFFPWPGTRNSKRPSKMPVKNWKHLARQARKVSMERPVARLMSWSQNLRVSWKPVNRQDCVWKNLYRTIMKTILQVKETIHCSTLIWYTNLFLCLKLWKFLQQKQQWIRNGKNWRKFRRGTWPRSEVRKRWSMKQGCRAQKFILHHWWRSVI